MFELITSRLRLRDMTLADEGPYVALSQDAKYQRFYDEQDCQPSRYQQLTRLFIEQAQAQPRVAYQLAIEERTSGLFIGTVSLRLESEGNASIGCGLARAYQGKGYVQEAAKALVDYGFDELGVHRVYAETIGSNKAAMRLCRQLGMRQEAVLKEHRFFKQQRWDTLIYAMLKQDRA